MSGQIYDGLFNAPPDVVLDFEPDSSLTKQEFKDECDINVLMRHYQQTGLAPPVAAGMANYGDFSQDIDFLAAQRVVVRAREQFEALPSGIRDRFNNDPARFLAFINDKANLDEAAKLGLLSAEAMAKRNADAAAESARIAALEAAGKGPGGPAGAGK